MGAAQQLMDIIYNAIMAIMGIVGGLYGLYYLWDGFTGDQPESKKRGVIIIIVTAVILIIAGSIKSLLVGLIPG